MHYIVHYPPGNITSLWLWFLIKKLTIYPHMALTSHNSGNFVEIEESLFDIFYFKVVTEALNFNIYNLVIFANSHTNVQMLYKDTKKDQIKQN